jgi:hypothetical protein
VAPGLAASAVASCDQPSDLLVSGGCSAQPMWRAQLLATQPIRAHDPRTLAGWQCDYRNTSSDHPMEVMAEVYCAPRRR